MSDPESENVIMDEYKAPEQPRSSIRDGEPSLSIRNKEESSVIVIDKSSSSSNEDSSSSSSDDPSSLGSSNEEPSFPCTSNEEPSFPYTSIEESRASIEESSASANESSASAKESSASIEESSASSSNEESYSLTVKDKNHVSSGSTEEQPISSDTESENSVTYCTKNLSLLNNIESDSSFDLEDYALYKLTQNLATRPYNTKYLLETNDYESAETEYEKFLEFIESYREPGKTQLSALIFPLFVHLYLFLLTNPDASRTDIAQKFYGSYSFYFKNVDGYEELLEELFQLKNIEKVKNHKYFKNFWQMKYVCKLPFDVLTNLKLSLEKSGCKMLIHILHFHFFFEDVDSQSLINLGHIRRSEVVEEDVSIADIRSASCFDDHTGMMQTQMCCLSTSEIVISHNSSNIASVDVCDSNTEIAVTYSCAYISVAHIEKVSEHYKIGPAKEISLPGPVSIVKYVPGSQNKVLVVIDTRVLLLNTSTGKIEFEFDVHHKDSILDLDISLFNEQFATGGNDTKVVLWYFSQKTMIKEFEHDYVVEIVKFHPNGLYLATGSFHLIRLWYTIENHCVRIFVGHTVKINNITFSPNGKMLASSDILGRIKVWDIKESCVLSETSGYVNPTFSNKIMCLCFSHDSCFTLASIYRRNIIVLDSRDSNNYYEQQQKHIPLLIRPFKNDLLVVCKENIK